MNDHHDATHQAHEQLAEYWDAFAAGHAVELPALDSELALTVQAFQQLARHDVIQPDARFVQRLLEDLLQTGTQSAQTAHASLEYVPNGQVRVENSAPRLHPASRSRRLAGVFATAALVLLVLLGGIIGFRLSHQLIRHAGLPVANLTPRKATPTPDPIAEFVWQSRGSQSVQIGIPSQVAIDLQGNIWVPDSSRDQFLLFSPDGTFLEAWGAPGSDAGQLRLIDPAAAAFGTGAVAFDSAGNSYVADTGNHRIQKFGPDRRFITSWGGEGSDSEQFRRPFALAVDSRLGRVYVTDEGWGTIEVFDDQGTWLATWSGLGAPGGIAVAGDGTIWVAEGGSGLLQFSPDGKRLATWDAYRNGRASGPDPVSAAIDAEGRVFVADMNADQVVVLYPDGSLLGVIGEHGQEPGQFDTVRGLTLDGKGGVYVTDLGGKRLQKFQLLQPLMPAAPSEQ